eukprot:g591.t1
MEDLQNNKFFAAMKHIFPKLEEEACSRQWTLLIPQSTAIQISKFTTKSILFSHILQPLNQYYPGFFLTLNGKSIKYSVNERSLKACSKATEAGGAFAEERIVHILFEEVFFVGDDSFKVFCINRPITGPGDVLRSTYDGLELFSTKRSAKCWVEMLRRSKIDLPAVTLTLKYAMKLNSELMNGTINDTDISNSNLASDIEHAAIKSVKILIKHNPHYQVALKQGALFQLLSNPFETMIHEEIYPNVFSALCNEKMKDENSIQIQLHNLRLEQEQLHEKDDDDENASSLSKHDRRGQDNIKWEKLNLEAATIALSGINNERSPLAKLDVVVEVGTLIATCYNEYVEKEAEEMKKAKVKENSPKSTSVRRRRGSLATDDLLPIYIRVVVQAAPGLLLANLQYMSAFAPSDVLEGKYGFYLATFESAVMYIRNMKMQNENVSIDDPNTNINTEASDNVNNANLSETFSNCGLVNDATAKVSNT